MKLLEGVVEPDVSDPRVAELESEVRRLTRALADARLEADRAREDATRALSALRRQLNPLYRALQAIFGELDAAGVDDAPVASPASGPTVNPRVAAVWESWKQKLGAGPAKVIEALLLHGELNTQQLAIAVGVDRTTIPNYVHRLNKAGLIAKNGGRFSLKQL